MDIGMMDTTRSATGSVTSFARTGTPRPAPPPETASDYPPPSLVERMPQASALSLLPAFSADALALSATAPQLQPATELLNLPNELLRHLTSFLRTANTLPAIRNVARFRASCKDLYQGITAPIPDGMMGLVELNRLVDLKQMLVELQQSGKDVAKEVNSAGKLVKIRDFAWKDGCLTPLMAAAYLGHAELATVLVKAGATIDQTRPDRRTALMIAAQNGYTATVQALLQAGATVDQVMSDGRTALMFAARKGQAATVQALLAANADCKLKSNDGNTAWSIALTKSREGVIKLLRAHGAAE